MLDGWLASFMLGIDPHLNFLIREGFFELKKMFCNVVHQESLQMCHMAIDSFTYSNIINITFFIFSII